MKISISISGDIESTASPYAMPDQLAGRLSQQTEPSDEEILEAKKRKKEEELEEKKKEAEEKAEKKDTKKPEDEKASDDDSDDGSDSDSDDEGEDDDGLEEDTDSDENEDEGDSEDDLAGDSDSGDGEADEGDEGADSDPEESGEEGDAEEPAEDDDSEGESEDDDSEPTEEGDEVDAEDPESEDDGETQEEDEEAVASTGRRRIYRGQAASKQCVIVCGFPGVGKSTLAQMLDGHYRVADCDSSQFSEDPTFPSNYVDHIQQIRESGKHDICFISTHDAVRSELKRRGIPYVLVYPVRASKVEYLSRYLKRGSPAAFVETLEDQWDAFIDSCEDDASDRIVLKPEEYLSDAIERITDVHI